MSSDKEIAVSIKDLHKSFKLPHEQHSGLKQAIINFFSSNRKNGYETQQVLKGLNFDIEKGDFFGIVGRNGSGKSTLLKTLAGIYSPDKGAVIINGTLVPFIELGVGFNPELTGRENVFLNGALLGFSRKEMEEMYDDIVEFAELERFMDQKLKNYSSGMQVRLAFSIAIRANGDILLLDEVLAVGDEAFQRKCYEYFAKLKKEKRTVILVTHSMETVQQFCNKAALIDKESKLVIDTPFKVAQIYRKLNTETNAVTDSKEEDGNQASKFFSIKPSFEKKDNRLYFDLKLDPLMKVDDDLVFTFVINKDDGEMVYRFTSDEKIEEVINFQKSNIFRINLQNIFPDGKYGVQVGVKKIDRSKNYALFDNVIQFEVVNGIGSEFWRPDESYSIEESSLQT